MPAFDDNNKRVRMSSR